MTRSRIIYNPFFTKFCFETPDGWRVYVPSYDALRLHLMRGMNPLMKAISTAYAVSAKQQERTLEEKYALPPGYLCGVYDKHPNLAEFEHLAYNESIRLNPAINKAIQATSNIANVLGNQAHLELTLVYKYDYQKNITVKTYREVISETRIGCHCILCVPLQYPNSLDCSFCNQVATSR